MEMDNIFDVIIPVIRTRRLRLRLQAVPGTVAETTRLRQQIKLNHIDDVMSI